MMKIPERFKRVAAAFDEAAALDRSYESSGSEHSADLSDLVNSFLEREIEEERRSDHDQGKDGNFEFEDDGDRLESNSADFQSRDSLKNLFDLENDAVKGNIHKEVDIAYGETGGGDSSSPDFKRRLMARLRRRGLDAGLCKLKWEKNGSHPSGDYEYVDVIAAGTRYIIAIFLAGEFTIARPTISYASLLDTLPTIFVGKPEELKQVVRVMCSAVRKSMKSACIHVPPWRRLAYMQNKWFGSYKRTTNAEAARQRATEGGGELSARQRMGFAPVKGMSFYCREDFAAVGGVRMGNLTAALNRKEMLL